jgi:hypothetical protein
VAIAANTGLVADRFGDGLSEADADVFDGVVRVNVEVAVGFHSQIEDAMFREERQHVIEKTDSGINFGFAGSIKVQP